MKTTLNGIEREFKSLSLAELYELQAEYCREVREAHERSGLHGMLDTAADRQSRRVPEPMIHARILELTPEDRIHTLGGNSEA